MTGYIAFFSVKAEAPAVSNRRGPLPVLVWDCPDQSPIIGRTQPYKPAPSTPQTIRVMMGFILNFQTIASAMAKKIKEQPIVAAVMMAVLAYAIQAVVNINLPIAMPIILQLLAMGVGRKKTADKAEEKAE